MQEKHIIMTPGNIIDIDQQVDDISRILRGFNCQGLGFDPAKAYHGVIQGLQKNGYERILKEYPQGIRHMTAPIREIEREVMACEVDLMGNPVIRWMFRNVVTITDTNDNVKVDKKKSQDKIDGVVAYSNAVGTHLSMTANPTQSPYSDHTFRVLEL